MPHSSSATPELAELKIAMARLDIAFREVEMRVQETLEGRRAAVAVGPSPGGPKRVPGVTATRPPNQEPMTDAEVTVTAKGQAGGVPPPKTTPIADTPPIVIKEMPVEDPPVVPWNGPFPEPPGDPASRMQREKPTDLAPCWYKPWTWFR